MPIKVLFFDIGNVLLRFDALAVARKMSCLACKNPLKLARYLWTHGPSKFNDSLERGDITSRELYRLFRDEFGFEGSVEEFRRIWCDHFTLEAGTAELVRKLRRRYRLYLLSNTNAMHYDFIRENFEFTRQVHGAVLSYKLGLRKPEPAIFRAALKIARVDAPQAVFIDDLARNVAAAKKVGLRALQYTGIGPLRKELESLGVL